MPRAAVERATRTRAQSPRGQKKNGTQGSAIESPEFAAALVAVLRKATHKRGGKDEDLAWFVEAAEAARTRESIAFAISAAARLARRET